MIEKKGLYPSYIHFNVAGKPEATTLRRGVKVFDNNGFVASFVTFAMMESAKLGIVEPSEDDIEMVSVLSCLPFLSCSTVWLTSLPCNRRLARFWTFTIRIAPRISQSLHFGLKLLKS